MKTIAAMPDAVFSPLVRRPQYHFEPQILALCARRLVVAALPSL
jgi:hypothetical protein